MVHFRGIYALAKCVRSRNIEPRRDVFGHFFFSRRSAILARRALYEVVRVTFFADGQRIDFVSLTRRPNQRTVINSRAAAFNLKPVRFSDCYDTSQQVPEKIRSRCLLFKIARMYEVSRLAVDTGCRRDDSWLAAEVGRRFTNSVAMLDTTAARRRRYGTRRGSRFPRLVFLRGAAECAFCVISVDRVSGKLGNTMPGAAQVSYFVDRCARSYLTLFSASAV